MKESVKTPEVTQQVAQKAAPLSSAPESHDFAESPDHSFATVQLKKVNNTGLPENLKSGMENLSGMNLNHVKVHYNSPKPATVQAHAYAQGSEIHLAAGQEKHLPHELGHVVQQMQGEVKSTRQLQSKVAINDDPKLEREADVMGDKAMKVGNSNYRIRQNKSFAAVVQRKLLTKEGVIEHSDKLPQTASVNAALITATNSQETWFVENSADIQAIGSAKGGQLVPPSVHIIGESHKASQWGALKAKWGYSKKIAYEDLADSKTVKSTETAHHLKTDPHRLKENIIENLHAKFITDLAVVLHGAKKLTAIYTYWETFLRNNKGTEAKKMKDMGKTTRQRVIDMLGGFDFYWQRDYVAAGKAAKLKEQKSPAERMLIGMIENHGEQISKDIKSIKDSPIALSTFRALSKADNIKAWLAKSDQLTGNIKSLIEYLHTLVKLETEETEESKESDESDESDEKRMLAALKKQKARIGALGKKSTAKDVLDSASPLREHAMTLALRKMGAPSIALMGQQHQVNLEKAKQIQHSVFYTSYEDFVKRTTSKA